MSAAGRLAHVCQGSRAVGPPREHVVETEVDDHISLYDARGQEVLVLNETASDVWRLCDGERSLDEIVSILASAYGVDPDAIRSDVVRTIQAFQDQALLAPPRR